MGVLKEQHDIEVRKMQADLAKERDKRNKATKSRVEKNDKIIEKLQK